MQPGSPTRDPIPPVVTCEGCRRFQRDTINPVAGMGGCERGLGYHWPMQRHRCREREAA